MTESWAVFTVARFVVGVGGVILNVVLTKMLVDWFAENELSTAMAILVNSWPLGIALALLVMPAIAGVGGISAAWWAIVALTAAVLFLFALIYRAPEGIAEASAILQKAGFPAAALILAGLVWALYNAALAMVFSFGPAFLVQVGYSLTSAGSLTSLFMVIFSIALPIGGIIADRTGRKDAVILVSLVSLVSFAVLIPIAVIYPTSAFALFCILGVLFALGAGPVMTLPAEVLSPKSRAMGMGVFFSIYYALMMIGPRIGGGFAESTGDAGTAILAGAVMSLGAAAALVAFRRAVRT
jgi:MFS family permease